MLAVEEPFALDLGQGLPSFVGVIDLVEEQDGRAVIVEHKTAGLRFSDQRVRDDLQATPYSMAAVEMRLPGIAAIEDVEVRFQVLLKQRVPTIDERPTKRTAAQAAELVEVAQAVVMAREVGVFPPNRGWQCSGCPFEEPCRK